MQTSVEQQSTKNFSVDKSIIKHLVTHQAGSIEKAILELTMNSIDANATEIHIDYSSEYLRIQDNGTGFPSKKYIEDFFGVFGAPHEEGDATFGKFRMGRGQIFAYGSSAWRSGTFEMGVDIEKNGLSYSLTESLEDIPGCSINIKFYKEQEIYHNQFISMIEYCDVDIFVNGNQINKKIDEITFENEYFIFRKNKNHNTLKIYNQGVYVTADWQYSFTGILVSKIPMEVNFARNDVLKNSCKVWSSFEEYVKIENDKNAIEGINRVIPVHLSEHYVRLFFEYKIEVEQFLSLKIYKDVSGKYYNIFQIIDGNFKYITKADNNYLAISDALNQLDSILVLDNNLDYYLGYYNGKYTDYITNALELMIAQLNILQFDLVALEGEGKKRSLYQDEYDKFLKKRSTFFMNGIRERVREIRKGFKNYDSILTLEAKFPVQYKILKKKDLDEFNKDIYTVVKRMADGVYKLFRNNTSSTAKKRQLLFGDSQNRLSGWTDGESFIAIDIELIDNSKKGLKEIEDLALTILHEYCHSENDTEELVHDVEFYSLFHNALQKHPYCRSISELTLAFAKSYVKICKKHNIRARKAITNHLK